MITHSIVLAGLAIASLAAFAQPRTRQHSFGPGVCGPIDAAYVRTATETGGQPFPMSPSEIAKMGVIMAESSRSDATMILWAGGTADDGKDPFLIPVDASVKRLTVSITFDGQGGRAEIARPDGTVIQPGATPDDMVLNCGRVIGIDGPAPGSWRVTATPSARFWMVVHARSDRDLLSTEFVRVAGRPGHEGLFPISGLPIAGQPATLRVELSEPDPQKPRFVLFSSQGRVIQPLDLDRVSDDEYVGAVALPHVPFRVGIEGGADGGRYQRVDRRLFRAESVEVVAGDLTELKAGRDAPVPFTIRNHGGRARYQITALAGAEILKRIEPATADIPAKDDARIVVWVPARTIAAAGTSLELLVVAANDAAAEPSSNSALQRFTIVKN